MIVTICCELSTALTEGGNDISPAVISLGPVTDEVASLTSLKSPLSAISFRLTKTSCIASLIPVTLVRANQMVKRNEIIKGDLVLCYNSKLDKTFKKNFQIKWEGPFRVVDGFANGTYQLADLDGTLHASRVNGLRLKIFMQG